MKAKIYHSFTDKHGNEYGFDDYQSFAHFWFNIPQNRLRSAFPDNFNQLQRAATQSKEARTKI